MEHLAIVLWLALAPCQGDACGAYAWVPTATYADPDRCEALAERAAGGGQCLPRGWRPLAAPGADFIPRTWRAAI